MNITRIYRSIEMLFLFLLMITFLQSCRPYCYNCFDTHGTAAGQKCFKSEEEQNVWSAGQQAANPNQPTSCY